MLLTKNHAKLTAEVKAHIDADAVIQGRYFETDSSVSTGGKGCFIGCLTHSDDASKLQDLYGLPLPLVRLCEHVFEGLPRDDAVAFFAAIPDAVGADNKDLSRVHWQFLVAELRALPEVDTEIQAVIDPVIEGMDLLADGQEWDAAAARAAAYAAAARAAYAADAAAYAAYAAYVVDAAYVAYVAYAADAAADAALSAARAAYAAAEHICAQRDLLLRLIKDAPVVAL